MRHTAAFAPNPVPPEYRLEMAIWGAGPYAAAFFWFWRFSYLGINRLLMKALRWTSYPSISLWMVDRLVIRECVPPGARVCSCPRPFGVD